MIFFPSITNLDVVHFGDLIIILHQNLPSDSMPLDIEIYPVPFSKISVESIESMIVSIIISASVILIGIILERMLSKWWKKRK